MQFWSLFWLFTCLSSTVFAVDIPRPSQKPIAGESMVPSAPIEQNIKKPTDVFQTILDRAANDIRDTASSSSSSIITPPQLPKRKKPVMAQANTSIIMNNFLGDTPYPEPKPLRVRALAKSSQLKSNNDARDETVIIHYKGDEWDNGRTAGSREIGEYTIRQYAKPKTRLKETREKSPFKTKQLPRAGSVTLSDPVILFFREHSSDIEVGQIDILKKDIISPLKTLRNKHVLIYGYAEANKNAPDETQKLAVSRALMISDYLEDQKIKSDRIQIRAMGADTPINPKNRVDVVLYDRDN